MGYVIAAFYRFVHLDNYYDMRSVVLEFCVDHGIKGTIILAEQGINATISGRESDIEDFFKFLNLDDRFADVRYHKSYSDVMPFSKMKVRLKNEIVRLGIEGFDCSSRGTYLDPYEWDDFVSRPNVYVIDTRNEYEVEFGRFKGSISPGTGAFREFPYWAVNWARDKDKSVEIAMYCTGGIRCEKSTAFMKSIGFDNVYHLRGGILNYLKTVGRSGNLWEGECFVFDDRVAVDSDVSPSKNIKCAVCAGAVSEVDLRSVTKGHVVCGTCSE